MNQQNNQYEEAKSKMLESVKKGLVSMDFAKTIFPDISVDNDYERIRKCIRTIIQIKKEGSFGLECNLGATWDEILTWLDEQRKYLENFDEAEKEKSDFVGDGFVECRAKFLDFKKGNTYWLEYIGDDKYNVRSDNLLCKTYHITPRQLYTIFKKPTWLEKQDEQKSVIGGTFVNVDEVREDFIQEVYRVLDADPTNDRANQIIDAFDLLPTITIHKPDDKVEPKFNVGDWLCENKPNNYARFIKILEIINIHGKEKYRILRDVHDDEDIVEVDFIKEYYHKFDIKDAKDGDALVVNNTLREMIKEDFVSFEVAKLLKEKGFESDDCHTAYDSEGKFFWYGDYSKERKGIMDAPTLQMALKWLREVHGIAINISWGEIFEETYRWWCIILNMKNGEILRDSLYHQTYEEAANAAILYILKELI